MIFEAVDEAFPLVDEPGGMHDAPGRFKLLSARDLRALPDMRWAVRSVLPAEGLATIYGASASGKSFLALDLMASLAEAATWFGHGVMKPHHVVALVLEGEAGFRRRVLAWEKARGRNFPERVKFTFGAFNLLEGDDLTALTASIGANGGCDAMFIDTLNRAMPGADENSARDSSTLVGNLGWLQRALGCLVVVVHHTGKNEMAGMRGHSSMFAAMDAVIEVKRTPGMREWSVAKSKDDIDGAAHAFTLETVKLGLDFMDEPITSCVVRSIDVPIDTRPRPPTSRNQRVVYEALLPLFKQPHGFGKAGTPPTRPCLELEAVLDQVKGRIAAEPKRQTARAREAISGMVATGILGFNEGWLWLN
ncbi:AAA family ATPase [Hydrogenophaga sp.]|uniref:AAA family ATPase n=1 Tax=Hydrogenophaga sp. TaxID=1904254 RepID=UPI00271D07CB|nr:AAA family ATPase [Hydrogenophaga sp.]MDO9438553.1 AAA family ATPase [Hydrogenophaga sp.]